MTTQTYRDRRSYSCASAAILMGLMLSVGCAPVPLSKGMSKQLPTAETVTVVWGHDPSVLNTAILWLHSRNIRVIEPSFVREHLAKGSGEDSGWIDDTMVLQAARSLNAKQIVFVSRIGDYRAPAVFIQGVDVSNGEVLWAGTSRYADYAAKPPPHTLAFLTCRALQAAWQLKESERERCDR